MDKASLLFFVFLLPRTMIQCEPSLELFASTAQMQILIFTQAEVIKNIEYYVNKEEQRLAVVERFLKDTEKEHGKALADVTEYMASPINAFRLIKRLKDDYEKLEAYMPARVTVYKKSRAVYYPDVSEMFNASYGLVRLQMVYKLKPSDLAKGILKSTFSQTGQLFKEHVSPMTSSDCFLLGQVSYEDLGVFVDEPAYKNVERKLRWMLEAHKKFQLENCSICPFEEVEIIDQIIDRYKELGNLKSSIQWIQKRMAVKPNDPKSEEMAILLKEMQAILDTDPDKKYVYNEAWSYNKTIKIISRKLPKGSICYNNSGIPNNISKSLSCYYAHGPHPFLRLARLKAEKMYMYPDITLYYDVLSEADIKALIQIRLLKSMLQIVSFPVANKMHTANYRNAMGVYFNNTAKYRRIFNHITHITNMDMTNDDFLDVLNYGIGGHYSSHQDFYTDLDEYLMLRDDFKKYGDRLASIMFYLSDVEQGGATAFEKLGVLLYPVKGAALVWYNLHPSGDGNFDTLHESCPVLRGSKWIAVKWLREAHQTFCPIWRTKDGLMTQEKYLQSNIRRSPFRDERFKTL